MCFEWPDCQNPMRPDVLKNLFLYTAQIICTNVLLFLSVIIKKCTFNIFDTPILQV